jgi:dTDP-4-dehydrorhamnose reductase
MILLLGAAGYVGSAFERFFRLRGVQFRGPSRAECDYTLEANLRSLLARSKPSFVINCAGFTGKPNVDACENQKAPCLHGNAVFPGILREACHQQGIPWGHISSGCIFTGDNRFKAHPADFGKPMCPTLLFGGQLQLLQRLKGLGRRIDRLRTACSQRTDRQLCVAGGCPVLSVATQDSFNSDDNARNYLSKVIRYRRLLDVRNSLSHLDEFLEACWQCWERRLPFGVYNMTNPGSITTREITELMIEEGKRRAAKEVPNPFPTQFDFFRDEQEFMELAAKTPRSNCVIDTSKLATAGIRMTPIHEAVRQALVSWRATPKTQWTRGAESIPGPTDLYRPPVG